MTNQPGRRIRFEHYTQPLLPRSAYLLRLTRHGGLAAAFLSAAGILFAPVVHRALHRFHPGK
jgi:hypothetical protein